jgi:hypothetical protein
MAQIYLRGVGKLQQFRDDPDGIAKAFAALPEGKSVTLAVLRSGNESLMLRRSKDGLYGFQSVERAEAAMKRRVSLRKDYDEGIARRLLASFAAENDEWRTTVEWKRGVLDLPVAILGPATLAVCAAAVMLYLAATGQLEDWEWKYLPNLIVGIVMVSGFIGYADWFFGGFRQRLAGMLGGALGITIVESQDYGLFSRPGMWESADGAIVSDLKVMVLDFLVIIFGLVIPITVFAVALIFAALPVMA